MFHNYPYTDFHELNLDGLIAEWKKFLNEYQGVNERVDDMEQAIEDFREYINNYFENLDVQEEINNKLDEMEADGSLEAILSHYVYVTHNPDLVQVLNVAMNTHAYDVPSDPQPAFLQGYTCYNGVSYLAFMDSSSTTNDAIIRSYSNSTGQLLNENRIQNAYHANSMTVHEGHLLLCTNEHHIISMNPSSLAVEINYQVTKDIKSISSYNGVLYASDSNRDLWVMTLPPDETYVHKCNFQAGNPEYQFWQSNAVYGDYLYAISTNPKCIAAININTGIIRNIINIDDYYYMYNTGEIEDIAVVSGDEVYLATCTYGTYDQYRIGRVFNFSLNQNDARSQKYAGGDYNPIATIYVNDNTNGNPDGSIDNPFPTLSQAFQALSSPISKSYQTNVIEMQKNCDEIVYVRNMSFQLSGNNHSVIRAVINNCRAVLNNVTFLCNRISGNYYALHLANSLIMSRGIVLSGTYTGSSAHAVQFTDVTGIIVQMTTNNNVVKLYQCDVNMDDATLRSVQPVDYTSARENYFVAQATMTAPPDRTLYNNLKVSGHRYNTYFEFTVSASANTAYAHACIDYTGNYNFLILTLEVSYSGSTLVLNKDGYAIAADGTKTQLTGDPFTIDHIWYEAY